MTLPLIPAGLDFGNGWIKIVLDNKASKIPNWAIEKQPKGALNKKTMIQSKPICFPLDTDKTRWFGQDTLSLPGYQKIDSDKLKPEYIRMMTKAVVCRWLSQHRIENEWLSHIRLNVVCGMPPELYQDRQERNEAEKVYRHVFNQKQPYYIKQPNKTAIPFFTSFGGLKPETLAWAAVNKLKAGYTLLVDLGFGTSDFCLFHDEEELPISTITLKNGLLHSHYETNVNKPWEAELNTMRGSLPINYSNITQAKIIRVTRQITPLAQLVIFGGGVQLLDEDTLKDLRGYAETFSSGKKSGYNEFSNARWFEKISEKLLDERKKKELEERKL